MSTGTDTPLDLEEIRNLDDGEREAYLDQREAELQDAAEAELQEDAGAAREAAAQLKAVGDDRVPTEEVTLDGGVTIEVRTRPPGAVERRIEHLLGQQDSAPETAEERVESILDILCGPAESDVGGMVVGPEGYDTRTAWRDVYEAHGSEFLLDVTIDLLEPTLEVRENVESFRGE